LEDVRNATGGTYADYMDKRRAYMEFINKHPKSGTSADIRKNNAQISKFEEKLKEKYTPDEKEVYKNERPQQWHFGEGQRVMEGRFRPGHFEGMLSVVHLLLSTINPNDLFMGEKDFQQAWLVRRLVSALHSGTRFHLVDTVREPDGLAMSSRNGLLSDEERKLAATIPFALRYISEQPDFGSLRKGVDTMSARLMSEGIQLEYLELRDENELKEMTDQKLPGGRVFFAGMAGKVRLIDNVKLRS